MAEPVDTLCCMRRWFWILDATVIVSFAVIGRADHGFASDAGEYLRVSAPFLVGFGITAVAVRAWKRPLALRTGLALALGTLLIGMLLRRFLWDDGTARSFVLVASAYIVAGMVGWRLVVLGVGRLVLQRRAVTG